MKFNKITPLIFIITLSLAFCGKKKSPFLLLPQLDSSIQQSNLKTEVPTNITQNNQSSENTTQPHQGLTNNDNNVDNTNQLTSNSEQQSTNSGENTAQTPPNANAQNDNTYGNVAFTFNTSITVPVNVSVVDPSGPVEGALVTVTLEQENNTPLFQATTNSEGNVSGEVVVPTNTNDISITISVGNYVTEPINVNITNDQNQYLQNVNVNVNFDQNIEQLIASVTDTDGDGVSDLNDQYPLDPTRTLTRIIPASGWSIVAFEDLYPTPGDADSNDIVLAVRNEEDLDSQGRVVRIRGTYIFLANHAGYDLSPFINLPGKGNFNAKVSKILVNDNFEVINKNVLREVNINLSNFEKIPIFIKHSGYFNDKSYTRRGDAFYSHHEMGEDIRINNEHNRSISFDKGFINSLTIEYPKTKTHYMAEVEFIFDVPLTQAQLASAPYDLYIYVHNTGYTVHFPGFYFNPDGSDKYIYNNPNDSKHGFPWVFVVPIKWNWPSYGNYIGNAYPKFVDWYRSQGTQYQNWYELEKDNSKIFPYFVTANPISGYLLQFSSHHSPLVWASIIILIAGILTFLFIKGREKIA